MRTGWLSWVRANDKTIIDMLENQGANLVKATSSLVDLFTYYNTVTERKSKIKALEHEGDKITHDLFTITSQTFVTRSEEHTSELQSRQYLVCRLLLEKKKKYKCTSLI